MKLTYPALADKLTEPRIVAITFNVLAIIFFIVSLGIDGNISDVVWIVSPLTLCNLVAGSAFMIISIFYKPAEKYGYPLMVAFLILLLLCVCWYIICAKVLHYTID